MVYLRDLRRRKVSARDLVEVENLNCECRYQDRRTNRFGIRVVPPCSLTNSNSEYTTARTHGAELISQILYGQSIGGAVSIDLASRNPLVVRPHPYLMSFTY